MFFLFFCGIQPKMGPNSIARDHPCSSIFVFFSEFYFYIDFEWIFEAFWSHFGAILALEKRCFQDVFSAEFGSTCWHLFPLHLLLFLNYSNIFIISEMLLTIYKYVRTLNVVFVHRSALSRSYSL